MTTPLVRLAALTLLAASPALADLPPPPGAVEAWAAQRVRAAGQACTDPAQFQRMTAQDEAVARERGRSLERLRCANGRSYLVSPPQRGVPQPNPPPPLVLPAP